MDKTPDQINLALITYMLVKRIHFKDLGPLLKMQMDYTVDTEEVLFSTCSVPGQ